MIEIIKKSEQGYGAFNGGEIVENKPIGFPQDNSKLRPYSNLFYWAHAKAVTDSTIGLHPHKGFEICSFVLKGEIKHYDTQMREWRPLSAGDAQIIRAGNGISHSEFMGKGSEMFQIWFDPNLSKTLRQPASYDDYVADRFPTESLDHVRITNIVGQSSPFVMDTPGIAVQRIEISSGGTHHLALKSGQMASIYILDGEALIGGQLANTSDFVRLGQSTNVEVQTLAGAEIFMIVSDEQPDYQTYA